MHIPAQGFRKEQLEIIISSPDGKARWGTARRAELTNRHSEAFYNYLCRLLLRLTNCHSEALAEESLKLSNSYRDSSVVSLLQNDRGKCISSPDGVRGGTTRREKFCERSEQNLLFPYYPISLFPFKKGGVPC